jgi:aryl-alcohol dehydrogenase-like predicted oxidoreductase
MNSGNMAQYIEAVMRQRANVGTQAEVSPLLQLTSQSAGQDRAQMYLSALAAQGPWGSPLVGAPSSLINQILGLSTPSVEVGGPQGGQR